MRCAATPSEARLWSALSGKKLGVAFRRQFVVGRYIADFIAPSKRLIVEVDGEYHGRILSSDARRERFLRREGFRVLRFPADMVMDHLPVVVAFIRAELEA
jgi:very-short-patch-repair endonuclease